MANEISLSASLSSTKTGLTVAGSGSINVTQAAAAMLGEIQNIGATTEALAVGDITDMGYLFVKNTDADNFVLLSLVSPAAISTCFCKLLPGEFMVLPTRQEVIYAIASPSPADCQIVAVSL
jgi:hypothetical protein